LGNRRGSGGKVELFLLRKLPSGKWEALVRPGKRIQPGSVVELAEGKLIANIGERTEVGGREIEFSANSDLMDLIWRFGEVPLPPYIARPAEENDKATYQTIYAKNIGAVAAPTAGFHFTDDLLNTIRAMGVGVEYVTLHPGLGTFRPITVSDATQHKMQEEYFSVPLKTADPINTAKPQSRRVIAIGTTSVRTLESAFDESTGKVLTTEGAYTGKFIYPPYKFNVVNCLLTNFHLPKSTLLLLVSALAGREKVLAAYQEAVERNYRFYSYGDAMLII
jgi:S-adenosylmethionine:tRNA ribosyltransferase-isomerase